MGDEYLPQNQTTNEKISVNEGIVEFDSLETHYKQTKEKLRFHESLIYSMTDTSPLAFYVVDNRTDEILYFNHRFCEIWGITHLEEAMRRDELKNQDIVPYCLPLVKNVPAFLESCKPLQNEEVRFTVEDEIQFVDGRTIRRVSSQIRGELDRYFGRLYIFEDATDRKRLDDELRKITERIINYQEALLELAKMDNADLELTLKRVTEVDSKTLGVERVSVWLFNEDHSEIICKDVYNMSEKIHQNGLRLKAKDYSLYFQALEESRTLAASDALTDPRTSEYTEGYLKPFGITSMMDVPIRLHGKVVGVVCHEHTGPMREWTAEEQDFAASIADMVSLALEASERNRIEEALRKGEERYRALYEDNPSMYFTVDTEGKVLSVNLFGAEQLGYKAHELVGQSVLMIFHPDDREGVLKQMRVCLQNPNQIFQWEFRKIRKDGSILWVKEAARAIQGAEGGAVVLISCEDITERKQMEEALQKAKHDLEIKVEQRTSELRKSNEQLLAEISDRKRTEEDLNKRNKDLEILNAITQAVHQSLALKEVYRVALDKVIELENVDLACIYLVDEARNEAVIQDQRNIPEWFIQRAGRIPYPKGVTWRVINTGNIVNVKNAQEDPYVGPAGRELGFRGMLGIPITLESKTIGVIWLISYKEYLFTRSEEELLLSICSQISIAISKARLYEREFNQRKRIEALQVVSQSVTSKLDYRSVLQDVVENTNSFMGSRFSIIALQEGDYYIPKAVAGDDEGLREVIQISPDPENMWGRGRGGECLRTKTPIVANDLRNDPPLIWRTELIKRGILSVAIVPLIIKGEAKGLLLTYSGEPYAFDEDKINLLTSFANQAAIAIENARLYEETKRHTDELRTLYEDLNKRNKDLEIINAVTQAVHQSFDLEEIYKVALDMITGIENVDMAMVYLVDKDRKEAVLQAHRNVPEDYLRRAERIPYPRGITWKLINTGKMLNVEDIQKDTDIGPAGRDLGHHSVLGIPIFLEKEVIGVIWFLSYKERKFDEREVNLLSAIGDQIAIAIAKAKLYRELSKKNRYEKIISTVTQSVHQSINLQEVMENAVEAMSKNMDGVDNVCIYLVEGEEADSTGSPQAVMKAYRGYPGWFIERVSRIPYLKGFTWKTIIEGKPRYVADVDQDTVIGPAGREMGTKSYASMPIQFGDKTVGCININSLKKNAFDEEEIKLLEIVSHQIEIAINNARQAELLRQSEERYRTLFDQSPVGVYIFDRNFKITHCNERFVQILRSSFDKIIGLDIRKLKDQCVLSLMEKVLRGESAVYEGYYEATGSEAKLWASIRLSPLRDANGKVTGGMAVIEDITDRKRAEEALKENFAQLSKKTRYETIISTVTRSVHQTINLQDVLENAVEAMSKNIDGADNVSIYLVEGAEADSTGSPQAVIKSYRGYSEAFIGKVRRIPYPKGITWKTIIEGKPLYCPDVDQDTVIGPAGREMGTKSYASMPIQFEGKTIGCININSLEKDAFDEEELKLLEIVAQQIEIAITNAQQAELLYQAKEELGLRVQERTQELSEINEELRKEIAERNRVEEEMRQTQSFLNSVVENIPDMIFVKDAKDLRFVRFNKAGEELLGYSRGNLIGKTAYDFFPKEEADFFTSKDREVLEGSKLHDIPEEPIHTRNKGRRILHTKKIPIFNADGKPRYLLGISEDITERKLVEKQIKSSLEEKEVLLKEVHHRVKNNLQVISSLLDLQSEYVKGKKTREVFHENQNRVRAIAHIHERFYQSKDLARIDFAEYIRHLGNYLFQSYGVDPNFIKLKVNVQDVVLDVNTAIPCGLIINELISNSLKHAFRKRKKGEICIDLHSDIKRSDSHRHRLYTMTVRDNGVGFPKDLDFRNTESLGLQLVNALTNQIGGSIGLNRRYGTAFKITFSNQM